MKQTLIYFSLLVIGTIASCSSPNTTSENKIQDIERRADSLAHANIIIDGHVDIPYRLWDHPEDISVRTEAGHFDYVRAKEGGLDAPIMSIYIPSARENNGAKALADSLIDLVEGLAAANPDKFALATSPDEIEEQFSRGLISLPMGMENGAAIEGDLENLRQV